MFSLSHFYTKTPFLLHSSLMLFHPLQPFTSVSPSSPRTTQKTSSWNLLNCAHNNNNNHDKFYTHAYASLTNNNNKLHKQNKSPTTSIGTETASFTNNNNNFNSKQHLDSHFVYFESSIIVWSLLFYIRDEWCFLFE